MKEILGKGCGLVVLDTLYKTGYIIVCVGNITNENSCVNTFEFPNGVLIPKLC
jgi:hypothetical protein